jgi:hypothetical protein
VRAAAGLWQRIARMRASCAVEQHTKNLKSLLNRWIRLLLEQLSNIVSATP